jgi:hypothetical protein
MPDIFTRAIRSRGIYTGAYTSENVGGRVLPRPPFFVIVNRKDAGMVRLEIGLGQRSFWADWGHRDDDGD